MAIECFSLLFSPNKFQHLQILLQSILPPSLSMGKKKNVNWNSQINNAISEEKCLIVFLIILIVFHS